MRLNIKAFGLTFSLIWGVGLFFLTWWVILFEGPTHGLFGIGHIYRGYNISPMGSLIGLVYALVDGGIGGVLFAWLYNLFAEKFK